MNVNRDGEIMGNEVALARLPSITYPSSSEAPNPLDDALRTVAQELRWSSEAMGMFGNVIPPHAKVVIKPNFVTHENQSTGGMLPLVTHQSVIKAVTAGALAARPSEVLVGDAPLQGCDFRALLRLTGLDAWADDLQRSDSRFKGIRDFRRTISAEVSGVRLATEELQPEEDFVLFDVGAESFLDEITERDGAFRVTQYDPRLMARKHAPGKHQYLVARQVIGADVVINLPKLKTHKKAGITCALKNLIGINGNKEYLPHHRIGGQNLGGDCYPGDSQLKRVLEYAYDRENSTASLTKKKFWHRFGVQIDRMIRLSGDNLGVEGSWSGNDTIWRTCLDLNRILIFGREDGSLADTPQRKVIHLVDAVVAGQGDGPLAPLPLELGSVFGGENAAAVDWIGALLLGYNPELIPIVREAFGEFRWPLTNFSADQICVIDGTRKGSPEQMLADMPVPQQIVYPTGWRGAVLEKAQQPLSRSR